MSAERREDGNRAWTDEEERIDSGATEGEPTQPEEPDHAPDGLPAGLRYILIGSFLVSAILLLIAFVYPRLRSLSPADGAGRSLPDWKKRANHMIDVATQKGKDGVPELLKGLNSTHPKIRQNAEWGLHHVTGLPWADKPDECRRWWKQYGELVREGKTPPEAPPRSAQFPERYSLSKINLEVFFNLLSSRRVTLSRGGIRVNYEVGVVNRNEHTSVRIFPPVKLPYRAYRYRPRVPENISRKFNVPETIGNVPVHLKYGPSVMLILIKWYDPNRSLTAPVRSEFLTFNVLGRGNDQLKPGKMKSTRSSFPIRLDSELMSSAGPHVVARLVLDGRSLLLGYGKDSRKKIRGTFQDVTHVLKMFRKQPEKVPGYSDRKLSSLRKRAREAGYRFTRAERMAVGGYVTGPSGDRTMVGPPSDAELVGSSPTDPGACAADLNELSKDTLMYVPEFGWTTVRSACPRCSKARQEKRLLSRIEVRRPSAAGASEERSSADAAEDRRWVLVFDEK